MSRDPFHDFADIPDPLGPAAEWAGRPPAAAPRPQAAAPTRGRTLAIRSLAVVAALLYEGALLAAFRAHASGRPAKLLAIGLAAPVIAGALGLAAGAQRGRRGLGLPAARIAALTLFAPVIFVAASSLGMPPDANDGLYWHHAVACMITGTCLTAGPVALVALAWRRAFAAAAAWRTAAMGVASGALGVITLTLICPVTTAWHVAVGHGAAIVLGGLAGAAVARWTAID
jgi:hypothetical protein